MFLELKKYNFSANEIWDLRISLHPYLHCQLHLPHIQSSKRTLADDVYFLKVSTSNSIGFFIMQLKSKLTHDFGTRPCP